ncbi:MAG: twin-arginine translocation signal domain-containing protein [Patescibacteria group bacterium]
MTERQPFSRRDFLKVALAGGAGLGTGLALSNIFLYSQFLKDLEETSSLNYQDTLRQIENNILVSDEGQWSRKVRINRGAFATLFSIVAMTMNPERGFRRLGQFFERYPFNIEFADENWVFEDLSAQAAASFNPRKEGGPILTFYPVFLDEYKAALENNDLELLRQKDTLVTHEVVHLNQLVSNPSGTRMISGVRPMIELLSALPRHFPQYDYDSDPLEIEARQISEAFIASSFPNVANLQDLPWPFGRFFEFI